MNVTLPEDAGLYIRSKIENGVYNSEAEVIVDALRLLKDQDLANENDLSELRSDIEKGFASVASGQFREFNRSTVHQLADEIKAEGRRRKADRANQGA